MNDFYFAVPKFLKDNASTCCTQLGKKKKKKKWLKHLNHEQIAFLVIIVNKPTQHLE